jgi:hypothetical protein
MMELVQATGVARRLSSAVDIVEEYESQHLSEHPLFRRLRREPVNLQAVWVLVANMNAGISPNFVRWLALTIARADDVRIASLLAKQLADELGNGDFERIHRVLLERFVAGLQPWRPKGHAGERLDAGERLGARATSVFEAPEPYQAIGGMIVAEIFAKKMDHCLGDEIRRQDLVPRDALLWLEIHEVLEELHAQLVPAQPDVLRATGLGARRLWDAMTGFLDDVAVAAFPVEA